MIRQHLPSVFAAESGKDGEEVQDESDLLAKVKLFSLDLIEDSEVKFPL